jgi:pyruvate,orthophosphate dikinase
MTTGFGPDQVVWIESGRSPLGAAVVLRHDDRVAHMTPWLYRFEEIDAAERSVDGDWDRVRGLLGGKGANLADMARIGVPVPPGFTITTRACNAFSDAGGVLPPGLWDDVVVAMQSLESTTGKQFGRSADPLLVSCRSGAKFSMPGMMDTVLNIGLDDEVVKLMIAGGSDERFVLDSYRRLIQMFGSVVLGVPDNEFEGVLKSARERAGVATDAELSAEVLHGVVAAFKTAVDRLGTHPFPSDPFEQLQMAVRAVFESWHGKRARDYRTAAHIAHDLGTAVNVVAMVFGNRGDD